MTTDRWILLGIAVCSAFYAVAMWLGRVSEASRRLGALEKWREETIDPWKEELPMVFEDKFVTKEMINQRLTTIEANQKNSGEKIDYLLSLIIKMVGLGNKP